ncbi:hypothetical protein BC936DRAFT_138445, partial [Jimgerdemannia flammicorona]
MLEVDDGHSVGVDEVRESQEVGVLAVEVEVDPVVVLEVAVVVAGYGTGCVLGQVVQVFVRVEDGDLDMRGGRRVELEILNKEDVDEINNAEKKNRMQREPEANAYPNVQPGLLVVIPDEDLFDKWVPDEVLDHLLQPLGSLPAEQDGDTATGAYLFILVAVPVGALVPRAVDDIDVLGRNKGLGHGGRVVPQEKEVQEDKDEAGDKQMGQRAPALKVESGRGQQSKGSRAVPGPGPAPDFYSSDNPPSLLPTSPLCLFEPNLPNKWTAAKTSSKRSVKSSQSSGAQGRSASPPWLGPPPPPHHLPSQLPVATTSSSVAPGKDRKAIDDLVALALGERPTTPSGPSSDRGSDAGSEAVASIFPSSYPPGSAPETPVRYGRELDGSNDACKWVVVNRSKRVIPFITDPCLPELGSSTRNSMTQMTDAARYIPKLTISETDPADIPPEDKVTYEKLTQTTDSGTDAPQRSEEEIRAQIMDEVEKEQKAKQQAADEERKRQEMEKVKEKRELTEEEKRAIVTSPDFADFVDHSSKIVERALNEKYDFMKDYTIGADVE